MISKTDLDKFICVMGVSLSPLQLHIVKYQGGCGSIYCEGASKIVRCRGKIPADVLFVGEAPGESEDSIGEPFVGPAGQLLDQIVKVSVPIAVRTAFTNLVGCIPREIDEKSGRPFKHGNVTEGGPCEQQIQDCSTRLCEFVTLCKPKLIICVGKHAADYLSIGFKHSISVDPAIPRVKIDHPAYILRSNIAKRDFLLRRAQITVRDAVALHVLGEE